MSNIFKPNKKVDFKLQKIYEDALEAQLSKFYRGITPTRVEFEQLLNGITMSIATHIRCKDPKKNAVDMAKQLEFYTTFSNRHLYELYGRIVALLVFSDGMLKAGCGVKYFKVPRLTPSSLLPEDLPPEDEKNGGDDPCKKAHSTCLLMTGDGKPHEAHVHFTSTEGSPPPLITNNGEPHKIYKGDSLKVWRPVVRTRSQRESPFISQQPSGTGR